MIPALSMLVLAAALTDGGSPLFDRYQVILDRKPFGDIAVAATAAPAAPKNPNLPPLTTVLRLAMLKFDDETGAVQAGLVDAKSSKTYYLSIGETEDDITLVQAVFETDQALVRRGGQEEWLTLGSGPKPGPTSGARPRLPAPPNVTARRFTFQGNREGGGTLTEVKETPLVRTNVPQWKSQEEMDEFYRQKNLELLRARGQSGPPLPIKLTPEDDDMLVAEGVLPPLEEGDGEEEERPEAGDPRSGDRGRRSDVRGPRSVVGDPRSEGRGRQ